MLGFGPLGQFPLGGGPFGPSSSAIGWYVNLSEPVRFLRDPRATITLNYQVFAFNPRPFVSFGWFEELSKPRRLDRLGLFAGEHPFFAFSPFPIPTPVHILEWFAHLSEPVRVCPRLREGSQRFTERNTFVPTSFTARLDTTEPGGDIFLSVLYQFNRARRALVSIFKK